MYVFVSPFPPLTLSFFIPLCQKKCFPWQGGRFLRPCAKRGCLSTDWDSPKPSLSAIWMELYCWNNAFGFHPCIHRRPAYLVVVLMLSPSIMVKRTGSGTMELGLCPQKHCHWFHLQVFCLWSCPDFYSHHAASWDSSQVQTALSLNVTYPNPLTINSFEIISHSLSLSFSFLCFFFSSSFSSSSPGGRFMLMSDPGMHECL